MLPLALTGWLAASARPAVMDRLEMPVYDNLQAMVRPPTVPDKFVVVLATEASMTEFSQWPWPRGVHAGLLRRLDGAGQIVIDILFPETSDPEQDRQLASAVRDAGNVILAVHIAPDDRGGEARLLLPYRELSDAAAGFGVANVRPEPDGVYRDAYLFWIHRDQLIPSLPFASWLSLKGEIPDMEETEEGYLVHLPTGPLALSADHGFKVHHPADPIPIYEYADVYHGRVPPETFRDAVVFVGVNSAGASDFFPVGRGHILPGAVYNANASHTLLHGWIPTASPRWASGLVGAILAAFGATAGLRSRVRRGWLWILGALFVWCSAVLVLFFLGQLWLPPVFPLLLGLAAFFLASLVNLRYLSAAWRVQSLSIDSLLFGSRQDIDPERLPFARYLEENWPEIRAWSGLELLRADAGDDDTQVRHCLEATAADDFGSQASIIRSRRLGNRLLIRLPAWEGDRQRYAVLRWHGAKSQETLKSAAALVVSAATNYQAVRETRAKRELFLGVIRLIMRAVDAKDPFTAGHSERVAQLSRELAERMGLPKAEIEDIYLSGLLHDVGKLGIPDAVLCKPGRLTDEEMDVMRGHPTLGEGLLGEITLPEMVMKGIVEHHERLDGKGYPHGLPAESLSLTGRILKVADVYDALVSKRQYKDPFPLEKAYGILSSGMGTEFDADIVAMVLEKPFSETTS